MAVPLIAPEKETFPNRIRWTVAECRGLADAGYLPGRYELIDGEILSKMGQNPLHRVVLMLIANWLVSQFDKLRVQEQGPIRIPGEAGFYTEPEPDIVVTAQATTAYVKQHPGPQDVLLVVEVSDTSLQFDLATKALLYARAGIREYWVADVVGRCLHIHRGPDGSGYRSVVRADLGDRVQLEGWPDEAVAAGAFFPDSIGGSDAVEGTTNST